MSGHAVAAGPVACGIDFGTSNSTLTLARPGGVQPVAIDPSNRVPEALPTLLFFDDDGHGAYGAQAVAEYEAAELGGRFLQALKKHLPAPGFTGTEVAGGFRSVEDLVAGFLEHLKLEAERAAGQPVDKVVLGRPARFSADDRRDRLAQDRLEAAASLAGFVEVAFQIEPMAAARSFEEQLDTEQLCLVGDLGGGTSDFTLVRLGPERVGAWDRSSDVLSVRGVTVGGTDLDARLVYDKVVPQLGLGSRYKVAAAWTPVPTFLHHAVCRWHRLSLVNTEENIAFLDRVIRTADDREGLRRLRRLLTGHHAWPFFRAVEAAKVELTAREQTTLRYAQDRLALEATVGRRDFEAAVAQELGQLAAAIDGTLEDAGLGREEVDVVFLTGGTSLVPAVRRLFTERFGDRIVDQGVFTSVGRGLGVEARERWCA